MNAKLVELLQQMLETELGGVKIYQTALECARNPKLREEWTKYLQQTQTHVEVIKELLAKVGRTGRDARQPRRALHWAIFGPRHEPGQGRR